MKPTLLIVFLLVLVTSAHAQTARRTMAVTFDDLPYVNFGNGVYIKNARAATAKILSTLKKHKVTAVGFVGCATDSSADRDSHQRTTGQYIDDKMLVQRVKSALDDSPVYKFPDVKVNTYNGTVQLTGFVETNEQKRKAEEIAKTVRDVLNVQNQIMLKGETERVRDVDRTIDGNGTRGVNDPVVNTNRTTTVRP